MSVNSFGGWKCYSEWTWLNRVWVYICLVLRRDVTFTDKRIRRAIYRPCSRSQRVDRVVSVVAMTLARHPTSLARFCIILIHISTTPTSIREPHRQQQQQQSERVTVPPANQVACVQTSLFCRLECRANLASLFSIRRRQTSSESGFIHQSFRPWHIANDQCSF